MMIAFVGCKEAKAIEMPDINGSWALLYNLKTEMVTSAPTVGTPLIKAFDGILSWDLTFAFPTDDNINADVLGGTTLNIDPIKLLGKSDKIEVMKGVELKAGFGPFVDIVHMRGINLQDWKEVTYLGANLGIVF